MPRQHADGRQRPVGCRAKALVASDQNPRRRYVGDAEDGNRRVHEPEEGGGREEVQGRLQRALTTENQNRDPRKGPLPLVLTIALIAFAIAIGIVAWTAHLGMFGANGLKLEPRFGFDSITKTVGSSLRPLSCPPRN